MAEQIPDIPVGGLRGEDEATFVANEKAFRIALPTFVDAANALAVEVENNTVTVTEATANALLYAQQAAAAAKYEGEWSTLTGSFQSGYSVTHNNLQWYATTDIADVTLSEPSEANSDWIDLGNLWRDTLDTALGAKYEAL